MLRDRGWLGLSPDLRWLLPRKQASLSSFAVHYPDHLLSVVLHTIDDIDDIVGHPVQVRIRPVSKPDRISVHSFVQFHFHCTLQKRCRVLPSSGIIVPQVLMFPRGGDNHLPQVGFGLPFESPDVPQLLF